MIYYIRNLNFLLPLSILHDSCTVGWQTNDEILVKIGSQQPKMGYGGAESLPYLVFIGTDQAPVEVSNNTADSPYYLLTQEAETQLRALDSRAAPHL
jgi:hypothetical protein